MKKWAVFLPAAALAACVAYTGPLPEDVRSTTIAAGAFPSLAEGAAEADSLHFKVRAYGGDNARQISDACEKTFNQILFDTNLFSFRPATPYQIVVYGSPDEFHKKTSQPAWSDEVAVGGSIYAYFSDPRLDAALAHEIAHLIFSEYMGRVNIDHRWVSDGLALYEEAQAKGVSPDSLFGQSRPTLRQLPIPMDQMIRLAPATEKNYGGSVWYAQAADMVKYMIEHGGNAGFSKFLQALSYGRGFDDAVAAGFPGRWQTLAAFEQDWKRSLQ